MTDDERARAQPPALKDFINTNGTRTVTFKHLDETLTVIFDVMKQQLDVERRRVGDLEARVLQLEAAAAVQLKVEA